MKNNWKPVIIEGALLENGGADLDGLIGIEECSDYNLEDLQDIPQVRTNAKVESRTHKKTSKKDSKSKWVEAATFPSKSGAASSAFVISSITPSIGSEALKESLNEKMVGWSSTPLNPLILQGLADLDFTTPREIQSCTIPSAIFGRSDILGAAETGSGKTLAFGIPILQGILQCKESSTEVDTQPLYALILAPTRELAIQIKDHLTAVAKHTGVKIAVVVGGLATPKQERLLKQGPEIVVATPGRLWELIQQGNEHLSQIESVRYLAIDETDRMLERGHFQELENILERLNTNEKHQQRRQNFVFSATLTLTHELPSHLLLKKKLNLKTKVNDLTPAQKLKKIVDSLGITNPKVVDITEKRQGRAEKLTECRIMCDNEQKDYYLYYFLKRHPGRTLIFCNSIGCVKRLITLLGLLGCDPLGLHASMAQKQRLKNLDRFRDRDGSILIATDVAARGLDIPSVEHVLHYQVPRIAESYVHRSGRTARSSTEGISVLLIDPSELQCYTRLLRTLRNAEDFAPFPIQAYALDAIKQCVNLAREVDKMDLCVRKSTAESSWYEKAAEEMDIIIDTPASQMESHEVRALKKVAQAKRKQLASLLAKPIFPKGMISGSYPLFSNNINELEQISSSLPTESAIDAIKNSKIKTSKKLPKNLFKFRGKRNHNDVVNAKDLREPANKKRKLRK